MSKNRLRTVVWALCGVAMSSGASLATEFTSEFVTDLDGWQQQWHKESPTGTDGIATHSLDRGYLDDSSLKFDMGDGFGDDGTLWIEKQFAVSAVQPTRFSVTFQLFNLEQSDFNAFQVKAAIGLSDPEAQADFETIGDTNTALGWVPFTYHAILPPATDPAWVAVGIRVAWETPRTFWIDRVVVSTITIPEPASAYLLLASVIGCALAIRPRPVRVCR